MKSPTSRHLATSPLSAPLDLLTEQRTGSVIIEISHSITSDIPDGRPWPPPDSNTFWALVLRADGYTLWRAIQLAQVRSAAVGIFSTGSAAAVSLGGER